MIDTRIVTAVWNERVRQETEEQDPVESALKYAHIVIPIVGAVMIFLMAFIAITMA